LLALFKVSYTGLINYVLHISENQDY